MKWNFKEITRKRNFRFVQNENSYEKELPSPSFNLETEANTFFSLTKRNIMRCQYFYF